MSSDINEFFVKLLRQSGSVDIARAEFKRMIADDDELKEMYASWCEETGHNVKDGFDNFCEEFMDSQQSIWESFNDFDE